MCMYANSGDHFRFFLPPVVEFGPGLRTKIPYYANKLRLKRPLLIVDPYFLDTEYFMETKKVLGAEGLHIALWHGVVPNPTDVSVDDAVRVYKENNCDGVVAIGGGSALDTAKGVAVVVAGSAKGIREYTPPTWKDVEGMAPVILLPTTAGTGAEVNPWAMITNTETGKKVVGFNAGEFIDAQKVAIVDPELTVSMPRRLTATTGMDAFCHAIECYLCPTPNPISDVIAVRAIHLVATNLRQAVHNGQDIEARVNMSLAALMATAAFPNAGLTFPHRLAAKVYDRWGLDHGVAVSVTLRASLEVLLPVKTTRLAEVAKVFGVVAAGRSVREVAEAGLDAIDQLQRDIDMPTFKEVTGATAEDVEAFEAELQKSDAPEFMRRQYGRILMRSLEL